MAGKPKCYTISQFMDACKLETKLFDRLGKDFPTRTNEIYQKIANNLIYIVYFNDKLVVKISSEAIWSRFRHKHVFVSQFQNINSEELKEIASRHGFNDLNNEKDEEIESRRGNNEEEDGEIGFECMDVEQVELEKLKATETKSKTTKKDSDKSAITKQIHINGSLLTVFGLKRRLVGRKPRWRVYPRPGWTDTLHSLIEKTFDVLCAFRYTFGASVGIFATGTCKECNGIVECRSYQDEEENKLQLVLTLSNVDANFNHSKKRQLKGVARKEAKKHLRTSTCLQYYGGLRLSKRFINGKSPSSLQNKAAFHKAKSEDKVAKKAQLPDRLKQLVDRSEASQFLRPEIVLKCFKENQVLYYQDFARNHYTVLALDATGAFIKPIVNTQQTSFGDMNLYTLHLNRSSINKVALPIASMISTRHRAVDVQYFLADWKWTFKTIPNEVIMDEDSALLNAVIFSFNQMSKEQYEDRAHEFLADASQKQFHLCIPRIDRNHIIPTINKHTLLDKNDFYSRAIILLIDETDFTILVEVLGSVLVMISSKYKNSSLIVCEENIQNFIKGNSHLMKHQFDIQMSIHWCEDLFQQIRNIQEKHDTNLNASYNNGMISFIERMTRRVIFWTGLLPFKAGSKIMKATSASLESYHNILKNKLLGGEKAELDEVIKAMEFYVDVLLKEEIGKTVCPMTSENGWSSNKDASMNTEDTSNRDSTLGEYQNIPPQDTSMDTSSLCEISTKTIESVEDDPVFDKQFRKESFLQNDPRQELNFRNNNPMSSRKTKSSSFLYYQENYGLKSKHLNLAQNHVVIKEGKKRVKFTNMCALNSVLHLFLYTLANNELSSHVEALLQTCASPLFAETVDILRKEGTTPRFYENVKRLISPSNTNKMIYDGMGYAELLVETNFREPGCVEIVSDERDILAALEDNAFKFTDRTKMVFMYLRNPSMPGNMAPPYKYNLEEIHFEKFDIAQKSFECEIVGLIQHRSIHFTAIVKNIYYATSFIEINDVIPSIKEFSAKYVTPAIIAVKINKNK